MKNNLLPAIIIGIMFPAILFGGDYLKTQFKAKADEVAVSNEQQVIFSVAHNMAYANSIAEHLVQDVPMLNAKAMAKVEAAEKARKIVDGDVALKDKDMRIAYLENVCDMLSTSRMYSRVYIDKFSSARCMERMWTAYNPITKPTPLLGSELTTK
jgi:hypothetical protein